MVCVDSPCTPTKRYTEIFHTDCKGNIPYFPCKTRHLQSVSTTETEERKVRMCFPHLNEVPFCFGVFVEATSKPSIRSGLKQKPNVTVINCLLIVFSNTML